MTAAKTRVVSLFHSGRKLEIRFGLAFANLQLSLFPCFFPIQPMPCSAFLIFLSLSCSLYLANFPVSCHAGNAVIRRSPRIGLHRL